MKKSLLTVHVDPLSRKAREARSEISCQCAFLPAAVEREVTRANEGTVHKPVEDEAMPLLVLVHPANSKCVSLLCERGDARVTERQCIYLFRIVFESTAGIRGRRQSPEYIGGELEGCIGVKKNQNAKLDILSAQIQ